MHAQHIIKRFIETQLPGMHAARRAVFTQAVAAVVGGHLLSLTRLARALSAGLGLKAALKCIDRFIGNARIEREAELVGERLLACLSQLSTTLVIVVDWSAVAPGGQFVELRAAVSYPGMGRALTVYSQVCSQRQLGNAQLERALLEALHAWLVGWQGQVIVVSDAGFRSPWFAHIERLGWGWVGRVRGAVYIASSQAGQWSWQQAASWFTQASTCAQRHSHCCLSKQARVDCAVVLVRKRLRHAKRYGCVGHGSSPKATREARQSAHEPWLLVHSASLSQAYRPEQIVAIYAQRMQIEECFRDSKCAVNGMGQAIARSRSALRLHALLLIATLAAFLMWHIGQLGEAEGLHRRYKATTRAARELSFISLARLLCALSQLPLSEFAIHALFQRLGVRR
jgi:hypothetical protein